MNNIIENINWGDQGSNNISAIKGEIFFENVYEKYFSVQENDIVVDIGFNVGVFTCSILSKKPKYVFCIEPSHSLLSCGVENCLKYKSNNTGLFFIEAGIQENNLPSNVFCPPEKINTITFKNFVDGLNIKNIDFLKIDCEGGEYSIFNQTNLNYLLKNVKNISAEFHLRSENGRELFREFKNNILPQFKNYKAVSCKHQNINHGHNIDLTSYIFNDDFIYNYDCEFMMYFSKDTFYA